MNQDSGNLLHRSFSFGITGILLCFIPLVNRTWPFVEQQKISFINGFGIAIQLLALSIAVLVLRKRKLDLEHKEKAKRMIIALGVALVFFILNN
ncbi:hypothetical protein [Echinicola jeungdonensis]